MISSKTHAGIGFIVMGGMMLMGIILFMVVHYFMSKTNTKENAVASSQL
ncbi:hypothetical protein KFZ56_02335 [Virgibacillus sp. NKC19-3]|nr:hypothetical protein [Virgibacillus sp. NKC19-3]MBY7141942.1 hypothetical protein [Virgibacillus sp. NKC19-3]